MNEIVCDECSTKYKHIVYAERNRDEYTCPHCGLVTEKME